MAASLDQPKTFGTTGLAQLYHGINPARVSGGKDAPGQPGSPGNLMAQLDSHFNRSLVAAMHSNSALNQLATVTIDPCAEIKSSLNALATNPRNPVPTQGTRVRAAVLPLAKKHKLKKRIKTLKAAIKNNWKVGGFCSTHGHGIRVGHDNKTCSTKGAGHVNSETRAKILMDWGRTRTRSELPGYLDASVKDTQK